MPLIATRNIAQSQLSVWDFLDTRIDHVCLQELSYTHYQTLCQSSPYLYSDFVPVWDEAIDYGKGILSTTSQIYGLGRWGHEKPSVSIFSLPIVSGLDRRPRACQILTFERGTIIHTHLSKHKTSRDLSRPMLQKILTDHILVGDLNMEAEECRDRLGDSFCTSLDHCAYISHIPTSKTLDYVCAPDRMSIGSVQTVESELSDHRGLVVGVQ